jgi:hypothetical protein
VYRCTTIGDDAMMARSGLETIALNQNDVFVIRYKLVADFLRQGNIELI